MSRQILKSSEEINQLAEQLDDENPQTIISYALDKYTPNISISFSGAEDVVLIDMAKKIRDDISVFTLDTGRLYPETYRFIEEICDYYNIDIDVYMPDRESTEKLVKEKGLFSFYNDGHNECCSVRKIAPLKRALDGLDAWVTGQRKDQSPSRSDLPVVQIDSAFGGGELVKFNPLANWTLKQVWQYIFENDVPYNKLHEKGYISIGCEPCTRPVTPGQHEREGRWWWEEATKKECGLHSGNIKK
ncbi:adenylylsulfate reductase, thioredoxin dependent [Methanohalobium evestigatum Z-7303]|uniref:Adenosine 5'-phosphosulfate reductase n=1 Tax=Methanohalobium evestigatum (strain ATCC BAA-1072 / DSM 3721 / NBRC 107634 / OCM 161 / Z-7303) TaxID=644295 RepID=D7E9N7_METEZ|nr:phosphoadenylyl-sulfate reductase [Methanohalobium evestigatum]ADI74309.1 adenylylsulfate reductase, thioredoxin dependent [Methanohalobium evestigatum Z-7303]